MRIAIEGCMHGELTKLYETIGEIENREGYKIDLVRTAAEVVLVAQGRW